MAESGFSETASYAVVGTPLVNGSRLTEVSSEASSNFSNETALSLWSPRGNATLVSMAGENCAQSAAAEEGDRLMSYFYTPLSGSTLGSAFVSSGDVRLVNTPSLLIGHVVIPVTSYVPMTSPWSVRGYTIYSMLLSVGTVPGTHLELIMRLSLNGTSANAPFDETLDVDIFTKA